MQAKCEFLNWLQTLWDQFLAQSTNWSYSDFTIKTKVAYSFAQFRFPHASTASEVRVAKQKMSSLSKMVISVASDEPLLYCGFNLARFVTYCFDNH